MESELKHGKWPAGSEPARGDFAIVYFGNDWTGENRTSSHHIARLLGDRYPLLYVDSPGLRCPAPTGRDFRKLCRKLKQALQAPRQIDRQMWVMTMPQLPFRRLPLVRWLNQSYGRFVVRRAMKRLGFRTTVLWFTVPHPGPLVGRLGEEMAVYYCIDNYAGLPDVDQREVTRLDEALTRSADVVFVSATRLAVSKLPVNPNTIYSPHGVDFSHFNRASDPNLRIADGARNLGHPLIGFFGSIRSWIDIDLIAYLANTHPEWNFVLIGMTTVDLSSLQLCPNVLLAGPQPYDQLPAWAKAFDVAILPLRMNAGTINANPLKLREYLATGKPVVASSIPEIERFAHCVRIAHSYEEFAEQIQDALEYDTPQQRQARIEAVRGATWESRLDGVLRIVQDVYAVKRK